MSIVARLSILLLVLLTAGEVLADAEIESNNTAGTANSLSSGVATSGNLYSSSDVDYFKITVGSAGTMEVSTSASAYLDFTKIDVLNSSQQVIASDRIQGDETFSVGFNQAGTYYFRISQTAANNPHYSLMVMVSSNITAEIESNNTAGTANTLSSGVATSGQLYSSSDVDYFKITVGSAGTMEVSTSASIYFYSTRIDVLNSSQQVIASGSVNGDDTFSVGFNQAGTYYFRINQTSAEYGYPDFPYGLKVTISGDTPSAPTISLLSKTYSSANILISSNGEGAAPITEYTTTCETSTQGETWEEVGIASQAEFADLPSSTQISCATVATSIIGVSSASNILTFTTDKGPPSRPTITRSDYGDGEIYLYVTASNGGASITGYDATCSDGTNTFTGNNTSSPITVSGLTNDVAYTCTVTATNSVGTSSASAATDPITPEATAIGLPIWLLYQATQ